MRIMDEIMEVCGVTSGYRSVPDRPIYNIDSDLLAVSTVHFLNQALERDDDCASLENQFNEFANREDYRYSSWLEIMQDFVEKHLKIKKYDIIYTYNTENHLDQDFQFVMFEYNSDKYVLLHAHIGLDARVGFTKPRVFKMIDEDYFFDWQISLYCDECADEPEEIEFKDGKPVCYKCGNYVNYHNPAEGW